MLIISDFRNSGIELATLAVAFTDTDPGTMTDSELESLFSSWNLDDTEMTKIYDFSADVAEKPYANYLVLKYHCSYGDNVCPRAIVSQILCY